MIVPREASNENPLRAWNRTRRCGGSKRFSGETVDRPALKALLEDSGNSASVWSWSTPGDQ